MVDNQTIPARRMKNPALRIALIYLVIGALWILFSDELVSQLGNQRLIITLSIIKGWLYVIVTSTLLYYLIKKNFQSIETSRKQAEANEQRFKTLFNKSPVPFAYTSPELEQSVYNEKFTRLFGYSVEDVPTLEHWLQRAYPDAEYRDRVVTTWTSAIGRAESAGGDIEPAEYRVTCKDGTVRSVLISGIIVDEIMIASFIDITERKLTESYRKMDLEILQTLNETGSLQESVTRILGILREHTGVEAIGIRLNSGEDFPYFSQIGFSEDFLKAENSLLEWNSEGEMCLNMYGEASLECICGQVLTGHTDPSHPLFTRGGSFWTNDSLPLLHVPADKDLRHHPRNRCIHQGYASVALIPIINKNAIIGLLQLNDRHKGCFNLQSVELLEGIATNIGGAIYRKQTEEKLQQRDADIDQFIYTISHDLRSPLVTVKTFLGYLEQDMLNNNPERVAQDMQFIHSAADKMKLLLDELLELSRIDRIEAPPARIPFSELESEVLIILAGAIREKGAHIQVSDVDLMLYGERQRIYQVFQNLLENALKYSCAERPVKIELGVKFADNETIFFIRDNGIGIEPRYHSKIFGIFDKLNPKSSGAGLGLTMVKRIVEKFGGRIWVESEGVDKGSCFYFTMPNVLVKS